MGFVRGQDTFDKIGVGGNIGTAGVSRFMDFGKEAQGLSSRLGFVEERYAKVVLEVLDLK